MVTTPTSPRTLLDAVNELLLAINSPPSLTLLEEDLSEDASGALRALGLASLSVQKQDWMAVNREEEYPIDPDEDGHIVLPANTLRVRSAWYKSKGQRLVQRGSKLYDPANHTYALNATAYVDINVGLEFEDLTESIRAYITGLAARSFCLPKLPTAATFRYTEEYLQNALTDCKHEAEAFDQRPIEQTSEHFARFRRR